VWGEVLEASQHLCLDEGRGEGGGGEMQEAGISVNLEVFLKCYKSGSTRLVIRGIVEKVMAVSMRLF